MNMKLYYTCLGNVQLAAFRIRMAEQKGEDYPNLNNKMLRCIAERTLNVVADDKQRVIEFCQVDGKRENWQEGRAYEGTAF